jgi:hypothetical protein
VRVVDDLIVGWVDTSIRDLLRADTSELTRFTYWLVTSIDSTTDLTRHATAQAIVAQHASCAFLGQGVLIPGKAVASIAAHFDLFNGFDEAWLFAIKPDTSKPAGLSTVAPLNLGSDAVPPLLASWMKQSTCSLALGDGVGLNYATTSEPTARLLARGA